MNVRVPRLGRSDTSGHGCIKRFHAILSSQSVRDPRIRHVDRRAIYEQSVMICHLQGLTPYLDHRIPAWQHGDHNVRGFHALLDARGDCDAVPRSRLSSLLREIKSNDLMACSGQVGGHRPAHVAKSNERDR
jgi:hypothetical protein